MGVVTRKQGSGFAQNQLQLPSSVSSDILNGKNNLPCDEQLVYCSQCSCDNSSAKLTNSFVHGPNSIAKATNSTAN